MHKHPSWVLMRLDGDANQILITNADLGRFLFC
jgi:hypothetical protein